MLTLLIIFHLLAALILILVIMLQSGKAGDLSSAFGGANSQTAFGARGATTILTKVTTLCAVVFVSTSLGLAIVYSQDNSTTVMQDSPGAGAVETQEATPVESVPAPPAETSEQAPEPDGGTEN
jgi:preprotein translocase subunit SecG